MHNILLLLTTYNHTLKILQLLVKLKIEYLLQHANSQSKALLLSGY